MRQLLAILAGVLLAVMVPLAAAAQDTKTAKGSVTAVGATSITVKSGDASQTFNIDDKTEVVAKGGSTATRMARAEGKSGPTLAEIVKVGDVVEVSYHETGMHAANIRVLPPGAAPTSTDTDTDTDTHTATGIVTAVTATSVTVKSKEAEQTFVIDSKTAILGKGLGTKTAENTAAGQKTVVSDLVGMGDEVSVRFKEQGGTKRASEVRVDRKAPGR